MQRFGRLVITISVLVGSTSMIGCGGKAPEKVAPNPTSGNAAAVPPGGTGSPAVTSAESKKAAPQAATPVPAATNPTVTTPSGTPGNSPGTATPETSSAPKGPSPVATKINPDVQKRIQTFGATLKPMSGGGDGDLSKNDLKQVGLAFHNYESVHGAFPAVNGSGVKDQPHPGLSWRVYLLPFLDQPQLFQEFKLDEPWDSAHNKPLIEKMPRVYGNNPEGKTRLHVLTGKGAPFQKDVGFRIPDITDGTSNTLMCVVGGADTADFWTKPGGLEFDPQNSVKCLGSIGNKFLVGLMDGSVRYLSGKIKPEEFVALAGHADGTVISDAAFEVNPSASKSTAAVKPIAPVTPLAPASPMFDLTYVPADAFAAVVLHPRRIFEHPVIAAIRKQLPGDQTGNVLDPNEVPFPARDAVSGINELSEKLGIVPQNIDEFILILDKNLPQEVMELASSRVPAFGVIVRNSAPFPLESMLGMISEPNPDLELQQHEGVALLVSPEKGVAFGLIDDSMLVFGQDSFVKKMISSRELSTPTSALHKRLHAAGNRLFVLAVDAVAIDSTIKKFVKATPEIAPFAAYISGVKELGLTFDLDAPEMMQVALQFKSPELAGGLFGLAENFYNTAKEQQVPAIREQMTLDPASGAFLPYYDQLVAETKFVNSGDTISLTVPKLKNLDKLVDALKPAFEQAQKAAEQARHRNNMKQIGLALHNYHDTFQGFPALDGPALKDAKHPGLSWRVYLLPYVDEAALYQQFNLDEPWDSAHNKPLIQKMPKLFGENKEGKTSIHVFTGSGAPFQNGEGMRISAITDGTSNTIAAVEAGADVADIWTKPGGLVFDPKEPLKCLGEIKEFTVLMFDGSVRRLMNIEAETFAKLIQHQDGQPVQVP